MFAYLHRGTRRNTTATWPLTRGLCDRLIYATPLHAKNVRFCRVQNGQVSVSRDQGTVEHRQDGRSAGERDRTGGLLADSAGSAHRIRQHRPSALTG